MVEYKLSILRLSNLNLNKLSDPKSRLLHVIEAEYESAAEFSRVNELSNSYVSWFKKTKDPNISGSILSRIYDAKGINPLWVLKGEGPYKLESESNPAGQGSVIEQAERLEAEANKIFTKYEDLLDELEAYLAGNGPKRLSVGARRLMLELLLLDDLNRYQDENSGENE